MTNELTLAQQREKTAMTTIETSAIQQRIDELTTERERLKPILIQQAQAQIERELAPLNAVIGELKRLLEPATAEENNGDTTPNSL